MKKKDYNIVFSGLPLGRHDFEYEIDETFLDVLFDYHDLPGIKVNVKVELAKQNTMLEFAFKMKGMVPVECDLTGEPFDQELKNSFDLVVKFGDAYNDDDDEILILPHGEYEVNLSQFIYELIVLSLPTKFIHPKVEEGDVDEEALDLLEKYMPGAPPESNDDDEDDDVDPRWSKLKDLLN
ncbi:YceD family protein [Phaeocystidibacter luteus]|uniref:DUF177 domain-containing protein n=1 Tax=Phaeocystidibacter luteus TaxID=911197 RepID=A0A6N6RH39_9FLAO|nr:DUF177 domain-containing protein [Phaeocystidibacter luteus]KAB2808649.1 DUF177 domain-containing protein [Phaeocystidibacter luteus]